MKRVIIPISKVYIKIKCAYLERKKIGRKRKKKESNPFLIDLRFLSSEEIIK